MTAIKNWFEVDRQGLAKLVERRGKAFLAYELIANCWDTGAKEVGVTLGEIGKAVEISVTDNDPDGFADLTHSFTLFAESAKKSDPMKRGRFNLGEKLVLALCREAEIISTTGGVQFDAEGRHSLRTRREKGTHFRAAVKMTKAELSETLKAVKSILPPEDVKTVLNGTEIAYRKPIAVVETTLPTELSDAEGIVRRTARKTTVEIVECLPGETPTIYEMGIPVVEMEGRWSFNVCQKVPLSMERDNVTPAYLRQLRAACVNAVYDKLTIEDAQTAWVRDAVASPDIEKRAVETTMDLRFGEKRVIYDPSDPEGSKIAMSQGYTVIPPRAMTGEEWENVRRFEAAKPAGQVTPSPRPNYAEGGRPEKVVLPEEYTRGMAKIAGFAKLLGRVLLQQEIAVKVVNEIVLNFGACYDGHLLRFNMGRLGRKWFENPAMSEPVIRLCLHELTHNKVSDHLSHDFADEIARLGAKLALAVFSEPETFRKYQ